MRKLDRFAADFPDTYKLIGQTEIDKTYSMPKSYNLLPAEDLVTRKPRKISDEQRDTGKVMGHHFGGRCWKSIQTVTIGQVKEFHTKNKVVHTTFSQYAIKSADI